MVDLIRASVDNLVTRHDAAYRAKGVTTARDGLLWRGLGNAGLIFLAAITRRAGADPSLVRRQLGELRERRRGPVWLCDSFRELDLTDAGYERHDPEPWYVRQAAPSADDPTPAEFEIRAAASEETLAEFHQVEWRAFDGPGEAEDGYAPSLLDDPRFYFYLGSVESEAVAVATVVIANGVVGFYGVGTLPEARGRGYASALMQRALSLSPSLPAVLQPSPMAESMYRRLGFDEIGKFQRWSTPE